VAGLAARASADVLIEQWREFRPPVMAVVNPQAADAVRSALAGEDVKVLEGPEALEAMLDEDEVDVVLQGVAGAAGLASTAEAVARGIDVALANKESLVLAGPHLLAEAERTGSEILPVDSEHCAIAQALRAGRLDEVHRIFLTASGGALRDRPLDDLATATAEDALRHPTWSMGRRITIDSATLMNKALEVLEAVHLFGVPASSIEVVLHAQSVVHSMVEFRDGSVLAQLGKPDMRVPILWALAHPDRPDYPDFRLDIRDMARLDFDTPDPDRYPALELGYRAAERGDIAGAVLNAADERAVQLFLEGRVGFTEIAKLVGDVLDELVPERVSSDDDEESLEEFLNRATAADAAARDAVARRALPAGEIR
jgi:1-deoxy-D-xylulose-5-phosphate reductoisomerase